MGSSTPATWAGVAAGALVPIAVGCALLALFPLIEARLTSSPLVPPKAFTGPLRLRTGLCCCFSAALFPMWYVSSLYLQQVLGLSPLDAGLTFLADGIDDHGVGERSQPAREPLRCAFSTR